MLDIKFERSLDSGERLKVAKESIIPTPTAFAKRTIRTEDVKYLPIGLFEKKILIKFIILILIGKKLNEIDRNCLCSILLAFVFS